MCTLHLHRSKNHCQWNTTAVILCTNTWEKHNSRLNVGKLYWMLAVSHVLKCREKNTSNIFFCAELTSGTLITLNLLTNAMNATKSIKLITDVMLFVLFQDIDHVIVWEESASVWKLLSKICVLGDESRRWCDNQIIMKNRCWKFGKSMWLSTREQKNSLIIIFFLLTIVRQQIVAKSTQNWC